jgi:predicted metalloendopeptidase
LKFHASTFALAASLIAAAAIAQPAAPLASGIDRGLMDPAVRPQDDLFANANGGWLKRTNFPPDKAYIGAGQQIYDTTQDHLRALVEDAQRAPADAEARKIGELYASFMDEAAVEKRGLAPLADELAAIDAVANRAQLATLLPRLARLGAGTPIAMAVGQDDRDATRYVPSLVQSGLGLPNRDYFLKLDDPKFAKVRADYRVYLAKMLVLGGAGAKASVDDAQAILELETELAKVQWSAVENRDPVKAYNRVALVDLNALAPALDWKDYWCASPAT